MDNQDDRNKIPDSASQSLGSLILDLGKIFLLGLMVVLGTRLFIFQPFVVSGSSMEPNFRQGDYLIIDEITYRFREPERGEVIVLRFPQDPSQFFIKRVIGLPGEKVVIANNKVKVTQEAGKTTTLSEEYLLPGTLTPGSEAITLDQGEYFVLGDNRVASSDSRSWGILKRKNIVGKAWLKLFPIAHAALIPQPDYSAP